MIEVGCKSLGVTIQADWMDAIVANFRLLARQAEIVLESPVPDHLDPAPVFVA